MTKSAMNEPTWSLNELIDLLEGLDWSTAHEESLAWLRKLKDQRERLRAALEPFAKAAQQLNDSDGGWGDRARVRNSWFFDDAEVKQALLALKETDDG